MLLKKKLLRYAQFFFFLLKTIRHEPREQFLRIFSQPNQFYPHKTKKT